MSKVVDALKAAWDWTVRAYHWCVDSIQEYPAVTFWTVAIIFIALAFWSRH